MADGGDTALEPIDYAETIAWLKRQRAELDVLIGEWERMAAADAPQDGVPTRAVAKPCGRRSTYLAAVELLRQAGRCLSNDELRQAMAERGVYWSVDVLCAAAKREGSQIEQVGPGQWALKG